MASISEGFSLNNQYPNFDRDSVATLEALRNVSVRKYDVGHIVYCEEDGIHYKFMGSDVEFDKTTGYFHLLVPSQDLDEIEKKVDDNATKIEAIWNELFPPAPIVASISMYKAGTSLSVPSTNLIGTSLNIDLKFSLTQDGKEVPFDQIKELYLSYNGKKVTLLPLTKTYTVENVTGTVSFTITYKLLDGTVKSASTSTISFTNYSYYGVVDENVNISEIDVTKLTKVLKSSKSHSTTVTLNNQKNCYIYPSSYGLLTSIKDNKNYELINSYLKESIVIDGVNYYAYLLEYASTVENYKLTFS